MVALSRESNQTIEALSPALSSILCYDTYWFLPGKMKSLPMTSRWKNPRRNVADTARQMTELGLVVGTAGNVSVRLHPENGRELMAVTPSGAPYETLTHDDIPVTDFEIEPVEGRLPPSSESLLHAGIYRRRPRRSRHRTHPLHILQRLGRLWP